ncbi:MAG: hypothetical protein P8H62_03635, partial [Henriciella sp.]|nr:hypothetical protein [Henriciella sp.]
SAMMEQASLQLEAAYNVVSSEEAKPAEISFGDAPLQYLQRQYKIIVGGMPRNSGIWTCNLDGWVFKVRATWIGDDIVPFAGIDSFTSRLKPQQKHFKHAPPRAVTFKISKPQPKPKTASPLSLLTP